ncbi:cytosolic 5'-nucleotidase 1A-like isoform X2 [Simochromis diagramma]|uniref:cytosolic 5'-nucleotidase 1A-like isoform X2 n=1 Tax=Simochromis diagramma TaxID=43689 RepID=UPI001A7E908B|nr:cytosolic 5'-nucleotidase 1A-like isoform X2 [Simochromis diagramma]
MTTVQSPSLDVDTSSFFTELSLAQALEAVNAKLRELYPESEELFDVVLITNNHANVGLRLINTINHHRQFLGHLGIAAAIMFTP